jgi:hypothetical protein
LYLLQATTTTYDNLLNVSSKSSLLFKCSGYNAGPTQFIQFHDRIKNAPVNSRPILFYKCEAEKNFEFTWDNGRWFNKGIVICNSTTPLTRTPGALDIWLDCQFQ